MRGVVREKEAALRRAYGAGEARWKNRGGWVELKAKRRLFLRIAEGGCEVCPPLRPVLPLVQGD